MNENESILFSRATEVISFISSSSKIPVSYAESDCDPLDEERLSCAFKVKLSFALRGPLWISTMEFGSVE